MYRAILVLGLWACSVASYGGAPVCTERRGQVLHNHIRFGMLYPWLDP